LNVTVVAKAEIGALGVENDVGCEEEDEIEGDREKMPLKILCALGCRHVGAGELRI
jgi:hypothetical protein